MKSILSSFNVLETILGIVDIVGNNRDNRDCTPGNFYFSHLYNKLSK